MWSGGFAISSSILPVTSGGMGNTEVEDIGHGVVSTVKAEQSCG